MPNHVAVNPKDHKTLRVVPERSEAMGDGMMCCVTFPEEFRNLQAYYPILFQLNQTRDEFVCLAVMGFENGENLFLQNDRWDVPYVPLAMDIQPFMIGRPQSEDEEQKVVIDLDSPRIGDGEGNRIFDDQGMATTYLENISKKLGFLDSGYKNSKKYIKALQKYELLEPLSVDVTLKDGSKNRLIGFHAINEEKLSALDDTELLDLHKNGYLMPTYMSLASLSNLRGLIDRKQALLADD